MSTCDLRIMASSSEEPTWELRRWPLHRLDGSKRQGHWIFVWEEPVENWAGVLGYWCWLSLANASHLCLTSQYSEVFYQISDYDKTSTGRTIYYFENTQEREAGSWWMFCFDSCLCGKCQPIAPAVERALSNQPLHSLPNHFHYAISDHLAGSQSLLQTLQHWVCIDAVLLYAMLVLFSIEDKY